MDKVIRLLSLYALTLVATAAGYCALFLSRWEALLALPTATSADVIFGILESVTMASFPVFFGVLCIGYLLDGKSAAKGLAEASYNNRTPMGSGSVHG